MSNGNTPSSSQNPLVVGIAIAIVVAYGAVAWFLFTQAGVASETWTRYTFLLSGIEAIAFTAAGYLFGKEVHREQAAKAEKRADDAQSEAKAANKAAGDAQTRAAEVERKGRDITELLRVKAGGQVGIAEARTDLSLREAAEYAQRLFPE